MLIYILNLAHAMSGDIKISDKLTIKTAVASCESESAYAKRVKQPKKAVTIVNAFTYIQLMLIFLCRYIYAGYICMQMCKYTSKGVHAPV